MSGGGGRRLPRFFIMLSLFASPLSPLVTALGYFVDTRLGDPSWLYHPVRALGWVIDRAEKAVRSRVGSEAGMKIAGATVTLLLSSTVAALVSTLIALPLLGFLLAVYFAYSGLALRCLLDEGADVERLLQADDIDEARVRLSYLVSRDTSRMDAVDIRRSLAETLSENFSDGFVAPLFYLCLFGPAGMWAYKTVNTFDSMWGYKNERYSHLGWFPARLDDVLNFIPARLSAVLILLVSRRPRPLAALRTVIRQAGKMESPNAGWPMAACAIALNARMGGPTSYFGRIKQKPLLGGEFAWDQALLARLLLTLKRTGGWSLLILISFQAFLWFAA